VSPSFGFRSLLHDINRISYYITKKQRKDERSASTLTEMEAAKDKIECVGSLLIHSHDVQELDSAHIPSSMPDVATLKKRPTVGTLLVPTSSTDTVPSQTTPSNKDKDDAEKSPSLIRRITELCQPPDPDESGYDEWME
jgi:hypothetical protein